MDLRINETFQTGAVGNRTYRGHRQLTAMLMDINRLKLQSFMGFGFLFGFHARTMGRGRHHRAVALSSPTKAKTIITYLAGKLKH